MYTPIDIFWQIIKGKYKAKILIYLNERTLRYSKIRKKFAVDGKGWVGSFIPFTSLPLPGIYNGKRREPSNVI